MRRIVAGLGLASLIVGGSSLALVPTPKPPEQGQVGTFLVPPNDGYGIADCLTSGNECGRTVAESYCQAKGYHDVVTFGPVDKADITGTTAARIAGEGSGTVMTITCQN